MLKLVLAAFGAGALTACVPDMPTDLLAPLDPAIATHAALPQGVPTRGLKPFAPAATQDWLGTDQQSESPSGMKSMPGMGETK